MPIDPLTIVGVANVVGLVFKPILEDFAKDVLKDTAKDYVKGCFGSMFSSLRKEPLQRALGKSLRELLQLIQDELLDCGLTEEELEDWIPQVKEFTRGAGLQQALRQLFTESDSRVDPSLLARSWEAVAARSLPEGFSWQRIAGRFTRAVRSLREQDAELRDILNTQAAAETARAVKQQAGLTPDFDLDSYREALLERYANLHFQTLDTTGAYYSNVKLWSVFVPQSVRETQEYYPQLLEIPKEHLRRMRERGEIDETEDAIQEELVEERRRSYIDQSPRPVLEVCDDDRIERLVFLGDPGSGKSSLLQFLALRWARIEDPTLLYTQPFPLFVELREYDRWQCASGKSFVRFLHEGQTWHRLNQSDLDRKLRVPGAAVLLLDGLDEIFDPARREDVLNDIQRFSNDYPEARVIVTSRVFGYKQQRLSDAEFRHFMLQDLDDEQVAAFLDRWHETTFEKTDDRDFKKERLAKALRESPAIRELGGNPLLLTMMSILNRSQELPRDRVRLYEQASRVLLHEWDTERALGGDPQLKDAIGYPEKLAILREVADFMQHAPEGLAGNIIARNELERILRDYLKGLGFSEPHALARKLVDQLRERNFILCYLGGDSYAFVHRTFLEYFCASAIVVRFRQKLSMSFLKDEVFGAHWREETWHEVLCLVAGMIAESSVEQVGEIIKFLLSERDESFELHHVFVAARCYQEIRNPTSLTLLRQRLFTDIETLLQFDFPFYYQDWEEPDLAERRRRIRVRALVAASRLISDTNAWFKGRAENDDDWAVRSAAIQELARGWKDDPETLRLLKDRAANDESWGVRSAVVQEMARGWKDDPDTLPWLKDRASKDYHGAVRKAALQELARGWKDDSDIKELLRQRATADKVETVRQAAVRELARYSKDSITLNWLKARANYSHSVAVQQAAVHEVARGWKDDNPTRAWLNARANANRESKEHVRKSALIELARGWRDSWTLRLLRDIAANDSSWIVRQAAVQELARGWKDEPDTLRLLKDSAANDIHSAVRQAAVQAIAQGWKNHPDTLPWLKDRAMRIDEYWEVQQCAFKELVRGWNNDLGTLPLLKHVATKDDDWGLRYIAVLELARDWKQDPEIKPLLTDRAKIDENSLVRQTAIHQLSRGWTKERETLALLKDRAANDVDNDVRRAAEQELWCGWKDDPEVQAFLAALPRER